MDKITIKNRIKELKEEIAKDEIMIENGSEDTYWYEDFDFNQSLLMRYEEELLKIK